jgi:hypothetical protein
MTDMIRAAATGVGTWDVSGFGLNGHITMKNKK